jgi:U3 small nucleolar RNA-associated protein 10
MLINKAAVYPPLILLTKTIRLADGPFAALLSALLTPSSGADPAQRVLTLLFLLNGRPDWGRGLGNDAAMQLAQIPSLGNLLVSGLTKYGFGDAFKVVVEALLDR